MPHVALVPFTGFRIREPEMLELGLAMPGLQARAGAIAQLPALSLPPRRSSGDPPTSEVLETLEALADHSHPAWVGELYARRFRDRVGYDQYHWPAELLDQHAVRLTAILGRLREGPEMARLLQEPYSQIEQRLESGPGRAAIPRDQRAALETLLRLAGPGRMPAEK